MFRRQGPQDISRSGKDMTNTYKVCESQCCHERPTLDQRLGPLSRSRLPGTSFHEQIFMFSRHTRYVLVAFLLLFGVIFFLYSGPQPVPVKHDWQLYDSDLSKRIQLSHRIYDTLLRQRQKLIKRFGPLPKDIVKCVCMTYNCKSRPDFFVIG